MNTDIKFIQINLHHAKGATGILCRRFLKENFSVVVIQEPWVNKNRILGIAGQTGKLVYDEGNSNPRTAILRRSRPSLKFARVVNDCC